MDLTMSQACEELQRHRNSVGYLLRTGRLKGYKTSGDRGRWRIPEESIREYRRLSMNA